MITGSDMENYKIIRLSDHRDMIIMLTMDVSRDMLSAIQSELRGRIESKTIVYFDFLMSNGMSNRFFYASLSSLRNHGALKTCQDIPRKYVEMSDDFFEHNLSYIDASVLSSRQKALYKTRVSR